MSASKPAEYTLIYDGACGLCRRIVRWIISSVGQASRPPRGAREPTFRFIDYHNPAALAPLPVDRDEAENSVILISPEGLKYRGYEATAKLLALLSTSRPLTPGLHLPGIRHFGRRANPRAEHRQLTITSGMTASTIYASFKPHWANVLVLVLIAGAVLSRGDAVIGPHELGLALPARWGLLIMVGGGYVCGLCIGAASARRKPERPPVSA